MFTNQTENQSVIHALLKGQPVQYKVKWDNPWEIYDQNWFIENEHPFGPWHCADRYEWRVKPKTKEIAVEIILTKTLTLEGVKDYHYKAGEQLFFIEKHSDGCYKKHKFAPLFDNNADFKNEVTFFETEEAMNKAYEQIINAQKGL